MSDQIFQDAYARVRGRHTIRLGLHFHREKLPTRFTEKFGSSTGSVLRSPIPSFRCQLQRNR